MGAIVGRGVPRDRFFLEGTHADGDRVRFPADAAHKIVTVLRMRTGDRVTVTDSGATQFTATLEVDGKFVSATLGEPVRAAEPALAITVAQAVPKGAKMEYVIEKTTELGVVEIVPLLSARALRDVGSGKVERWRRVATSAAAQSGRGRVPLVAEPLGWDGLLARVPAFERVYVPWELAERVPLRDVLDDDLAGVRSVLLVIGPEGGFAPDEVERAVEAGARAVSLGAFILRTETAALAVCAALRYAARDL